MSGQLKYNISVIASDMYAGVVEFEDGKWFTVFLDWEIMAEHFGVENTWDLTDEQCEEYMRGVVEFIIDDAGGKDGLELHSPSEGPYGRDFNKWADDKDDDTIEAAA